MTTSDSDATAPSMSAEGSSTAGPAPGPVSQPPKTRPQRPCDACRKRKSRCELPDHDSVCVLCQFHKQTCTFVADPPKKKRRTSEGTVSEPKRAVLRATPSISSSIDPTRP